MYPKPNPVCVVCRKEMDCSRNGQVVEGEAVAWRGDRFRCPSCGIEVVAAFGEGAEREVMRRWIGCEVPIHVDDL